MEAAGVVVAVVAVAAVIVVGCCGMHVMADYEGNLKALRVTLQGRTWRRRGLSHRYVTMKV